MTDRLYKKLCDKNLLKQAWHLARIECKKAFIQDSFGYNDFAFNIDDRLSMLCDNLKSGNYHPHTLLSIDVPKDLLAVRPGSLIDINDLIVLFTIIMLIAPRLDKKLPKSVYSYRYRPDHKNKTLFKEDKILEYTFLKKRTILKKIDIFDPWYIQWPIFIKKSVYAYEKEGYHYLSISDIASYFENIDLEILRDFLLKYFPHDQRIINLLITMFEHWTWPTKHLKAIKRGIPQGNTISSFLGNIYLLPLDHAFKEFSKKYKISYLRYMDDVKIFSKKKVTAIKVIFKMNEVLRELHLNIQGSKTNIKHGKQIENELIDNRLEKVNILIDEIQKRGILKDRKNEIIERLLSISNKINMKEELTGKDQRLFRRIITAFMLLGEKHLVNDVLEQIQITPDARITKSAYNYLRLFPNESTISRKILEYLHSPLNQFDYHEAWLLKILRYSQKNIIAIQKYAEQAFEKKDNHWYVRVQAVNIMANRVIKPTSFNKHIKLYEKESDLEVKRVLIKLLCQLDSKVQFELLLKALYNPYYKISDLAKMLLMMRQTKEFAMQEINSIFNNFTESLLIDNFYKIGVLRFNTNRIVLVKLNGKLSKVAPKIQLAYLKLKVKAVLKSLEFKQQKIT